MAARIRHDDGDEYYFDEGCHITEWWNVADDAQVSAARARVEPGVTTRWHRLDGVTERYVILSGAGRVDLREQGRSISEAVRPGSVVFIPPGVAQRIACTGAEDLVFLAVCTPRFTPQCYEDVDAGSPAGTDRPKQSS